MSDPTDQKHLAPGPSPFASASFVDNPEPRCACTLLLDTSRSMFGTPIRKLNDGLAVFKRELLADRLAAKRVEIAVVSFGPVRVVSDFESPDTFSPQELVAEGETPMGAAVMKTLDMVEARKNTYREAGIAYYRPWVFLITDGEPNDDWQEAARRVHADEDAKRVQFFAVGVEGADMETLARISKRAPLRLRGLRFRDLFSWLSRSLQSVSMSRVGEQVPLQNPLAPDGWASVG